MAKVISPFSFNICIVGDMALVKNYIHLYYANIFNTDHSVHSKPENKQWLMMIS